MADSSVRHIDDLMELQQGCGSSRPVLIFLFRGGLHFFHVGAGLGQDVVEVVADADQGEALAKELGDARGTKQEESESVP